MYPDTRWKTHQNLLRQNIHPNQHLQNSVNKYGLQNFDFKIIKYSKILYLNRFEKLYIRTKKTYNSKYGYNKTMGGDGGRIHEDSMNKRLSNNNKIGVKYVSKFIDSSYKQGFRYRYSHPDGHHLYSYDLRKLKHKVLQQQYEWFIVNEKTYRQALKENYILREKYGR